MQGPFVAIQPSCKPSPEKGNGSSRVGRKPEKSYEECNGGGIPDVASPLHPNGEMIAVASGSDAQFGECRGFQTVEVIDRTAALA